jgi:hypothetical protein
MIWFQWRHLNAVTGWRGWRRRKRIDWRMCKKVPALAEVLEKVTERRRARSVWKFRPWSREMEMDRNAVEAIRRGCCVKPARYCQ